MKSFLWMGAAIALSFAASASAAVCPVNTWCFGGAPGFVSQGATYSIPLGTVTAYSEQITLSNGDIVGTIFGTGSGHPTLGTGAQAMFQTNDSVFDEGIGLAPYNPVEGSGSSFSSQAGISDYVTQFGGTQNTTYGNILELQLGSNIAKGTSLAFLLQAGIGASGDRVEVFNKDGSGAMNANTTSMNFYTQTALGAISTNGTVSQFSITKDTAGAEMIAIVADCHYILLDTITGSSTVPEPRFYGILLAGLLGLAGIVYQRRRAAQANA
jgi:hypothetical protein